LVTTALFPILSRSAHDYPTIRRALAQTLRLQLAFTAPLSAAICVLAPVTPSLLGWPADFANSMPLLMILSLHVPIVGIDMVLGTVVMAIGRERVWVRVGLAAAVFNVAGNLLAIPFFEQVAGNGPIGASIMTVLTEVWMCVGALLLLPRQVLSLDVSRSVVGITVSAIGAAMVASSVLQISFVLAASAGAAVYWSMVVFVRAVSLDDLRYVLHRFPRLSRVWSRANA
jgi:O-antigen/teichoic acid export membrane protein